MFLIIIYFQGALVFQKYLYNVIDNMGRGGGGGLVNTHPMTIFLKLLNIVDEMIFKKIHYFGLIIIFSFIITILLFIIIK